MGTVPTTSVREQERGAQVRKGSEVDWLTVEDVSNQLQVNIETVRRWIRAGELEVLSLGSRRGGYRIHPDALDAFIGLRYGRANESNKEADGNR